MSVPEVGEFVRLPGRTWLVEGAAPSLDDLSPLRLACGADDALFGAYLRTVAWNTATDTVPRRNSP
jgi:hypothetical protein